MGVILLLLDLSSPISGSLKPLQGESMRKFSESRYFFVLSKEHLSRFHC